MSDPAPSGLNVRVLRASPGGRLLERGDRVGVFYAGTLTDGTPFDANIDFNGFQPLRNLFAFTLGENRVIQGWEQGLLNRRVGEVLELTIPPELAYGSSGTGGIPPNATLIFRVVIVGMLPADQMLLPMDQRRAIYYDLEALGLKPAALGLTRALLADLPSSGESGNLVVGTDLGDTLQGLDAAELLIGLKGVDRITGGGGRDVQVGGRGADSFIFRSVSDSLTGADRRDLISDFQGREQGDRIDMQAIDANSLRDGDQAFRWIKGAAFSGVAGQLRYEAGVLSADVNGDRQADMEITLLGAPALLAGDLRL